MESTNSALAPAPQMLPPEAHLSNIAFGALLTQALAVAAKYNVADLIAGGKTSAAAIAAATGTNEGAMYRVLRSLAGVGVFSEIENGVFANNAYSEPLRAGAPNSMRTGAIFMGAQWHWEVWGNLEYSLLTGKSAWGQTHGEEVFDYFTENAEAAEIFNGAMSDMSMASASPVVEAYDFSGIETIADIAGGHGYLLSQILKANPALNGILFDMPQVVAGAGAFFDQAGVSDRVEKTGGDFFREVPGADAYIMKHIIHDWDDERSIAILRNIRRAMKEGGKVLLVETIVPEGNEPHYSKLLDLEMLVSPGGKERTAEEYRALFAAAGFLLTRVVPTNSPFSVLEAVKAD